jgi:hypothetical protein
MTLSRSDLRWRGTCEGNGAIDSGHSDAHLKLHRPTKEEVRRWLKLVIAAHTPPPSITDIRHDLWYEEGNEDEGATHGGT